MLREIWNGKRREDPEQDILYSLSQIIGAVIVVPKNGMKENTMF